MQTMTTIGKQWTIWRKAILLDVDGNEYYLTYEDGDLWAIPVGSDYDEIFN